MKILKVHTEGRDAYATTIANVRVLDNWLEKRYSIRCFESADIAFSARGADAPAKEVKLVNRLEHLIGESIRTTGTTPAKSALELTNLYANPQWSGWWHSRRRAWVLDSVSIAAAIVGAPSFKGACLDVGCGIGFLPVFLAEHFNVEASGLDHSENSILEAGKLDANQRVEFIHGSVGELGRRQWEFVSAVDLVQPTNPHFEDMMHSLAKCVSTGGHLLLVGNFVGEASALKILRDLGFSCLQAQHTGGFQQGISNTESPDWSSKGALHFVKRSNADNIEVPLSSLMVEFAEYANSECYPPHELNRSYYHAHLLDNRSS